MCKVTVSRMRERYAQTEHTFRITYVYTTINFGCPDLASSGRAWMWSVAYFQSKYTSPVYCCPTRNYNKHVFTVCCHSFVKWTGENVEESGRCTIYGNIAAFAWESLGLTRSCKSPPRIRRRGLWRCAARRLYIIDNSLVATVGKSVLLLLWYKWKLI